MENKHAEYAALLQNATAAAARAYAPYSGFKVGAALLARDGSVYLGCNVESASYSLTLCAERTALVKAVSEGARDFLAIAVTALDRAGNPVRALPCGACRQMLSEFCGNDFEVVMTGKTGGLQAVKLSELFPQPFALHAEND